MMKHIFLFFILLILLSFVNQKDKCCLEVINSSGKGIFASVSRSFPDTTLKFESMYEFTSPTIEALYRNKNNKRFVSLGARYKLFNIDEMSDSSDFKLLIYIFDSLTVETMPIDSLRDNYMILKRYEYSYKELDSLNWEIEYTGK